jgi:hypothetical protein
MTTRTVATGITRFDLDDKNVHGFMVRICRKGRHINEFFSDSRCGGKRKARDAADARYAELLEVHGPAQTSIKNKMTKRNTSGKVGVHVAYTVPNRWPHLEYWSYCASWIAANGSRGKISFSWNKYGEQEAWELASIARDTETSDRNRVLELYSQKRARRKPR